MDDELADRHKKLNVSLSQQLESQTSEVDRWRNECERLKAEILKYSTSNKVCSLHICSSFRIMHFLGPKFGIFNS